MNPVYEFNSDSPSFGAYAPLLPPLLKLYSNEETCEVMDENEDDKYDDKEEDEDVYRG